MPDVVSQLARAPRRAVVVIAIGFVVLALNVVGVLRYPGGPLRESIADGLLWLDVRPADQGSNEVGNSQPSDWANAGGSFVFGMLQLPNAWPVDATVEAVTPVDPTEGLVVEAVYLRRPGAPPAEAVAFGPVASGPDEATLARDFAALPATIGPTGDDPGHEVEVILVIRSTRTGAIGWSALAVDYRIGPLTFRVTQHVALAGCLGPLPPGTSCPSGSNDDQ